MKTYKNPKIKLLELDAENLMKDSGGTAQTEVPDPNDPNNQSGGDDDDDYPHSKPSFNSWSEE